MKKALLLLLAIGLVLALSTAVAFAAQPSPNQTVGETYSNVTGRSLWSYQDAWDTGVKYEGSYNAFQDQVNSVYTENPHGGYSTTTDKCETCHAVHRAGGAYMLLRVDSPDDACNYCHIGASPHSNRDAYGNSENGIYPANGHTIGAGPYIPDSSTWQWLETKTITYTLSDGETTSTVNKVRTYNSDRNKMFRRVSTKREGPTVLACAVCHQVHNASTLIWKPNGVTGYKLLRNSPSGSELNRSAMESYSSGGMTYPVYVPESTLTASWTGHEGTTTVDTFVDVKGNEIGTLDGTTSTATTFADGRVNWGTIWTKWTAGDVKLINEALSVWCADCHNLNIGYKVAVENEAIEFGATNTLHVDRTHAVPMQANANYASYGVQASTGNIPQCYSCHVTDMYPGGDATGYCGRCHLYPGDSTKGYKAMASLSDFPHSSKDYKLLGNGATGPYVQVVSGSAVTTTTPYTYATRTNPGDATVYTITSDFTSIDGLCLRCHNTVGDTL